MQHDGHHGRHRSEADGALSGLLERRHQLIQRYDEALHPLGIRTLPHFTPDYTSSGHLYLTWTPGIGEKERNEIILRMAGAGRGLQRPL